MTSTGEEDPALCELALREQRCAFHRARRGSPCLVHKGEGYVCADRIAQQQQARAPAAEGPERHAGDTDPDNPRGS